MSKHGQQMTGAEMVVQALIDQGVSDLFGYPGGAVLPIYDAIIQQDMIKHILVRHEQGAGHAAEGYARSTGKPGVALVTSGPGATNMVTPLTDALMDSIPIVCLTGQVPTHLIGNDAFQEADTVGITRPSTKHNWLVRDVNDLARVIHEAFYVAVHGRPGPVLVDIPKGRAICHRHLCRARTFHAEDIPAAGRWRRRCNPRRRRSDRQGQEAGLLYRRRRRQRRTTRLGAVARACVGDRLSDHLDADGAWSLSGERPSVARDARHAWHPTNPTMSCMIAM